jgi:hypothetical protein
MSLAFTDISLELCDSIYVALGSHQAPILYGDWILPSSDELNAMRLQLHAYGVGNFVNGVYWSSFEAAATYAACYDFSTGLFTAKLKSNVNNIRACRSFAGNIGDYAFRDTGPAGGLIFAYSGGLYYESALSDCTPAAWSNITDTLVPGAQGSIIGEGVNNTAEIIAQAGHTDSAAKLCTEYQEIINLPDGYITVNAVNYPVYVTMPKIAPENYVYIGNVIQTEDGTKDDFIYKGTVQIRVTTDGLHRSEKKLAQQILSVVRGIIKPTKAAVFSMSTLTMTVFKHESMTELIGQNESGLIRVDIIDIYNFILE